MIVDISMEQHDRFCFRAWITSSRRIEPMKSMEHATMNTSYGNLVMEHLKDDTTLICIDDQDHDNLIGFCTFKEGTLLYVYVKKTLRGFGFGRELVKASKCDRYALQPRKASTLLDGMVFDPFDHLRKL